MKYATKSMISLLCAVAMILTMLATLEIGVQAAEGLDLTDMQIVLPDGNTAVENTAASELKKYIFQMTGETLLVVKEGQNTGAGRPDRIRQGFRVGVTLSAVFCLLSTLLVYFFAAPLTALFLQTPEPELVEKVRLALLIVNGASFFCGLCSTYRPAVQAMGYAFLSIVPCFVEVGLQIFGALVLIPAFGFVGANLSTAAAWLAVACAVVPMGYRCLDKLCIRLSAHSPSSKEEPL